MQCVVLPVPIVSAGGFPRAARPHPGMRAGREMQSVEQLTTIYPDIHVGGLHMSH